MKIDYKEGCFVFKEENEYFVPQTSIEEAKKIYLEWIESKINTEIDNVILKKISK